MADEATAAAEPEAAQTAEPQQATDAAARVEELEPRAPTTILRAARHLFSAEQREAIKQTVASDCNPAELQLFLEVCARTEMDPFQKQIFAAKIKGKLQIIVSRDGLLAYAHRAGDLVSFTGDVVHAGDEFKVAYADGARSIEHSYALDHTPQTRIKHGGDAEDDVIPVDSESWRGPIVGAWAEVRRRDNAPTFFFAPLDEYNRGGETPWKTHKSAMILKVAEVYALRKAYTVSGVVGEEESDSIAGKDNLTAVPYVDYGDDTGLAVRLETLVEKANELVPGSYRPAKLQGLLNENDAEGREKIAEELENFIADQQEAQAEAVEGEVVPDAG